MTKRILSVVSFCLLYALPMASFFMVLSCSVAAQSKLMEMTKEESEMTYRLVHPLHKIESTSKEVNYRVQIDPATKEIKNVSVDVDVMSFSSGNSSRDSHAMEVIDAISFPSAAFTSTSITQNGDSVKAFGKLSFHGVTKDVTIPAAARWKHDRLELDGAFDISLTAFSVERPSLLLIPVEDKLSFSFRAVFRL